MKEFRKEFGQDRLLAVGIALLGVAAILIVVLGVVLGVVAALKTAFDIGIQTELLANVLTWFVVAALGSLLLLVPLWALDLILDAAAERLKDPTKTYTQYIGAVVAVCSGLISNSLDHDPIFSVVVGLSLLFLSTGAAAFIKVRPLLGIALYGLVFLIIGVVVWMTTSADEFNRWRIDQTGRDWLLIAFIVVMAVGVPLSVWRIESWRHRNPSDRGSAGRDRRQGPA